MPVYRCDWCGRFYSSPLPEGSACPNHIPEHNARFTRSIEEHNTRLAERIQRLEAMEEPVVVERDASHWCKGGPAFHAECWSCVSLIG